MRAAPATAEGISLLGDTLRRPPISVEDGQRLVEDLQVARGEYAAHPADLAYRLAVVRRTAALGRVREALELYTQAAHRHFDDPRPFRYRGETLIYLRQFRLAAADLERATKALSWSDGEALLEIPEHSAAPGGSLPFGISFYLGMAWFLQGDYQRASSALRLSLGQASGPEEFSRAVFWLWIAMQRSGDPAEAVTLATYAARVLTPPASTTEHQLLLALSRGSPLDSTSSTSPLEGYATGIRRLFAGRHEEARTAFEWVRSNGEWNTLAHVAAEAELVRLRSRKSIVVRVGN
jgi:tetratricopeptide (TPR) repeat protein